MRRFSLARPVASGFSARQVAGAAATAGLLVALAASATLGLLGAYVAGSPASSGPSFGLRPCQSSSLGSVERAFDRWRGLVARRGSLSGELLERRADSLVAESFALVEMSARIFGARDWQDLGLHRQREFVAALTRALRSKLLSYAWEGGSLRLEPTRGGGGSVEDGVLRVDYGLAGDNGSERITFFLAQGRGDSCLIVNLQSSEGTLLKDLRDRVRRLRDDYSFPYLIGELGVYGYVVLEDFEGMPEGELPPGWGWKESDEGKHKPYRVRSENGNQYLEATDEGESVILGKDLEWSLSEYPYVSFRVRVHEVPEGGDERYDDRVDSAAGVYFTYKKKMLGLVPESVKYVWSSTLPVGAAAKRDGIGRPWQVVFGTGRDGLGEWRTYVFDLRQAYRDTFGGDPSSKPIGIGVLSDANSTHSKAYADYDDIRALKDAPSEVTSGVKEIVTP